MKLKLVVVFNLFLFFLPFTQALTIDIFFPLKISELLLIVLILLFIQQKLNFEYIKTIKKTDVIFLFLIIATLSFIVNVFWNYEYTMKTIPFRLGPTADSFLRLLYIYLSVFGFFITIYYLGKNKNSSLNIWVKGAMLASIYGWYLFISSALELPYLKLIGMEEFPQTIMGIVRSGTFKEGNYFGLYLLLSSTIAFYLGKEKIAWFLMVSIITTFSTISIISALLFLLVYFKKYIFKKKSFKYILITLPFAIVLTFLFVKGEFYQKYIYSKVFTPISTLTPSSLSKVDRYLTGNIAYQAGLNNPIFGVGPYNYGLHYDQYNNIDKIVENHTQWSRKYFKRTNLRAIPNNVYLEVWAEYGVFGLLLFIAFLTKTLWISIKMKNSILTGGLLALYLSLNAFPSFIMLFIWVYLAIPYGLLYSEKLHSVKVKES